MMYSAIALFAVSAVLGLTILINWLTHKNASRGVIYSHGIAAALALVLLIVYAVQHPGSFPGVSILLFVLSALIGIYMFIRDLSKKTSPLLIAFIHALLAVSGFAALLIFVFI